jgi:hypothetical protein
MFLDRAKKLILATFFVLVASMNHVAEAQPTRPSSEPWYYQCTSWTPPPWGNKGARRLLFPATLSGEHPGTYRQNGKNLPGRFVVSGEVIVGRISEPGGTEPTPQFVTRAGSTIDFFADGSSKSMAVRVGRLANDRPTDFVPRRYSIECAKGDSVTAFEGTKAEPKLLADIANPPERSEPAPKLTDVFSGRGAKREAVGAETPRAKSDDKTRLEDVFREKGTLPSSEPARRLEAPSRPSPGVDTGSDPKVRSKLTNVFAGKTPSPSGTPSPGKAAASPVEPARADIPAMPTETPRPREDSPALRSTETAPRKEETRRVCEVPRLTALLVPDGITPASLQAVGIRNHKAAAEAFEYFSAGSDVRTLAGTLDITDSAGKIVPYEAVARTRRNGSDPLWVSVAGTDESRLRRTKAESAKRARRLRIIIVGGAAELSISGLDLVGSELKKPGSDPVRVDIEWYSIDETGSTKFAGRYSSLDALVRDAAAIGRERPDVLDDKQLLTLFDSFENLLKSQARALDKVFWIKGAYSIPSSIPQRFEKFLKAVSANSAIPRAPSGQPAKWLVIVTSRMPGFSIAYLKEPIYSLQIGDVIEESDERAGGPRRLIRDPVLLASRLRSTLATTKPGDTPPDSDASTGRLVLDASKVFVERGYVLSPEAAKALQLHLERVSGLWGEPPVRPNILAELADGTGKSQPTVADVLEVADHKGYPALPRLLPNWFRKPIKNLPPKESGLAKVAVAAYADGVQKLVEATRMSAAFGLNCELFYVAEAYFGFDKLQKSEASLKDKPASRTAP